MKKEILNKRIVSWWNKRSRKRIEMKETRQSGLSLQIQFISKMRELRVTFFR